MITVVTPETSICEEGVVSNITIEVDCDEGGVDIFGVAKSVTSI